MFDSVSCISFFVLGPNLTSVVRTPNVPPRHPSSLFVRAACATINGLLSAGAFALHPAVVVDFLQIKKAGCTVLLVQKSILRDAYNDLSIHFLAKVGTGACFPGSPGWFY